MTWSKSKSVISVLILLLPVCLSAQGSSARFPLVEISASDSVLIRKKPTNSSRVIGQAIPHDTFAVGKAGYWYRILDGPFAGGYLSTKVATPTGKSYPLAKSTSAATQILATAAADSTVIGTMNPLEAFAFETQGEWLKIKDGRFKNYFIASQLVKAINSMVPSGETLPLVTPTVPVTAPAKDEASSIQPPTKVPMPNSTPLNPAAPVPTPEKYASQKSWNEAEQNRFNQQLDKVFKKKNTEETVYVIMPFFYDVLPNPMGQISTSLNKEKELYLDTKALRKYLDDLVVPAWFEKPEHAKLFTQERVAVKDFKDSGIAINYDEAKLAIRTSIPVELRKENVATLARYGFLGNLAELEQPSFFSSFINVNSTEVFDTLNTTNPNGRNPLIAALDTGTRMGDYLLEGYGSYTENQGTSTNNSLIRQDFRIVRDFPGALVRSSLGDVVYPVRGFQVYRQMAGAAATTQFSMEPSKLTYPAGSYELFLQRDSKVAVWVNNQLTQVLNLPAGRHRVQDFPFSTGMNDIRLEITDDVGRSETINYSYFSDAELLKEGLHQFSYAVGAPSSTNPFTGERVYNSNDNSVSLFHRYGFNQNQTWGVNLQTDNLQTIFGVEHLVSTSKGFFKTDIATSIQAAYSAGLGISERFFYTDSKGENKTPRTWSLGVTYLSDTFAVWGTPSILGPRKTYEFTGNYSRAVTKALGIIGSLTYDVNTDPNRNPTDSPVSNSFTASFGVNHRWDLGITATFTVTNTQTTVGAQDLTAQIFLIWAFPKERQVITAMNNSANNSSRLDWTYNPASGADSPKYQATVQENQTQKSYDGVVTYNGNRAISSVQYQTNIPVSSGSAAAAGTVKTPTEQVTTLQLGTALVFAGGYFSFSRPVTDSFAIIAPVKNLKGQIFEINPTASETYMAKTDWNMNAALPELGSYNMQKITLGAKQIPPELAVPRDHFDIYPSYKSGYVFPVGTDATVYLMAKILGPDEKPITAAGRASRIGFEEEPITVFTNRRGSLRSEGFRPGKYRLEFATDTYQAYEFEIPDSATSEFDLGVIHLKPK